MSENLLTAVAAAKFSWVHSDCCFTGGVSDASHCSLHTSESVDMTRYRGDATGTEMNGIAPPPVTVGMTPFHFSMPRI